MCVPLQCRNYQSIMLVESAAEKPSMLKLISVAVQSARPAMTGKRDRFTHRPARDRGAAKNLATTILLLFQTSRITLTTKSGLLRAKQVKRV